METLTWTEFATASLVAFLLLRLITSFLHRQKLNLPPGPKPWPIIGNFNLIGSLPHRSLHLLSKSYGPIMMLRFGSHRVLVASSVDTAKLILKTQDIHFASRPKTAAGKLTTYNYSDITWSPYGPYWQQARKMCLMELFSNRRLDSYEYIRIQETLNLMRTVFNLTRSESPIIIKDLLTTLSLDVISRMVLGKKYMVEEVGSIVSPDEFKRMIDELFLLNGVLNIGDWIPYLGFLDLQGYVKRMKKVAKKFDRFLEHVLDEHNERRKSVKGWTPMDMVDVLLEHADHDPNLEIKVERDGVKAFTQDLIAGGTESSAVTVEWALSELLRSPNTIVKATEELDNVIGRDRWVEESDIPNLPYVRAIIKETMRLHPVAPMLAPRIARENVQIYGYDIPEGTRVLVNTWTIQRDPSVYENPEEFFPDRFIQGPKANVDVKGHDFELLPFGSGRRMCPGYNLGLKVIESSLANLLQGFVWRLPDGVNPKELDMEETFGLSNPRKNPLEVFAKPRLASHLYNM